MSVIAKEILKQYITCEDEATRNKFYNMLDSFWHKIEGKIIKSYTKDAQGTITGMTVLDKDDVSETVAFPVFPVSAPISFIQNLSTELGKLQPKVAGKGLSTYDLTLELYNKLNGLNNYQHPEFHQIGEIENLTEALEGKADAPAEGYGFSQENFSLPEKERLASFEVIDNLISTETQKAGAANQLRVLKGLIDSLNAIVFSDDTTLDEIQEIVNYIKQNKADLQNLSISNIAGLEAALNNLVTLDTLQTITGQKNFNAITFLNAILEDANFKASIYPNQLEIDKVMLVNGKTGSFSAELRRAVFSANRTFNFPDKSGTLALVEDFANLAPKSKPTKIINNATQYIAILEDKDKFLLFTTPINFFIPANIFAADDQIEGRNKSAGDVTVVDGAGMTVQVVSSQSKKVPQYGFFGVRFETPTLSGLLGQLKPI